MKTVVLVAPHFLPSFLPSVHRARLLAYHLEEFGWRPVILTTDPKYYECQVSDDILNLLPASLEIVRTRAFPTRPIRLIGDVGLRSLPWYLASLGKMARERRVDFLHITIPAFLAALLGPLVWRRHRIPYGIDYIDPWIPETPIRDQPFTKAWAAHRLSEILEPIAVRNASLITGINEAYFASVLRRNPHLADRVETAAMPYGNSDLDYEALKRAPRATFLFAGKEDAINVIYAGALLPRAFEVLDRLFAAIALLRTRDGASFVSRLRLYFVGTGLRESDPTQGHVVKPYIQKYGLDDLISEMPSRIGYLDVLNHLQAASAVLVIGSTEPHYSPSKLYQSAMSHRPVFAMLHERSTAVATMRDMQCGELVTFTEANLPDPKVLAATFARFIEELSRTSTSPGPAAMDAVSARASAKILAGGLDRAWRRAASL